MPTLGEQLVRWLEAYGVSHVFGIPGVHTVEMYRGLAASRIVHVTPRHEQGAGFMADGFARTTGRPGVAFVITGPGLTNCLTPMAQAFADSVPMLVISSVNRRRALGMGAGDLHQLHRQGALAEHAAAFSVTLSHPAQLPEVLARAWAVFEGARPRPVHIEIPLDLFAAEVPDEAPERPAPLAPPAPDPAAVRETAEMLRRAERPLLLAGGGARWGAGAVRALAEALGAPVVMTTNGRGILPSDHPLAVPASPALPAVRRLIRASDGVLALGTEIGRTDYDWDDDGIAEMPRPLARIDIDPEQLRRGAVPDIGMVGDAGRGAEAVLAQLDRAEPADRAVQVHETLAAVRTEVEEYYPNTLPFLKIVRQALPGTPIVGDSTRAVYAGNLGFGVDGPGEWFNAATGYGALGYGLPAAIGASLGRGGPVVCIAGDGGLQFSLPELGAAVEQRLPVILLVWDNKGYAEIKNYMLSHGITPVGVDLHTPDFVSIGEAYGAVSTRMELLGPLPDLLHDAAERDGPTVIVFDEEVALG